MKTYFRLLSFAKPIEKFAILYFITTLLYVVFSTLNLTLIVPLLQTLFSTDIDHIKTAVKPEFALTTTYFKGIFYYYFNNATIEYGKFGALKFVCTVIVCSAFLSNLFRYLSQRIMEELRINTMQNLRVSVFNNVMGLNIGYFNNERKGDIIAKIASDVQVVQFTVTSTLQVLFRDPLQIIAYFFVLFSTSAKLTLFSMIVVPVSGLIIAGIVKKLRAQAKENQERYGNMISFLDEALSGMKIIKAFNATGFIKKRFTDENVAYSRISRCNGSSSTTGVSCF